MKTGRFRMPVSDNDKFTPCFFRIILPTVWVSIHNYDTNAPIKWAKRALR